MCFGEEKKNCMLFLVYSTECFGESGMSRDKMIRVWGNTVKTHRSLLKEERKKRRHCCYSRNFTAATTNCKCY